MGEKSPQVAGDEPTEEFHVQASGQAPDFMKPSPGRHTKHKIHNAGFEPEVNDDDCAETSTAWRGLENQEPTPRFWVFCIQNIAFHSPANVVSTAVITTKVIPITTAHPPRPSTIEKIIIPKPTAKRRRSVD
jgi:hypothetical protein